MLLPVPLFLSLTLLVVDESNSCSVQQARLDRQENVSDCQVHLPQRHRRNITKVLPHLNLQVLIHLPSRNTAFQRSQFVAVHYNNDYYIGEVVVLSSEEGVVNFMAWCTIKLTAFAWPKLQRCQTDAQCTETLFLQMEMTSAWRLFHRLDEHGVFRT